MGLFDKRDAVKPYEYDVQPFIDAIFHSFRIHSEYNYTPDIQDYRVNMTDEEREIAKRCMLAISHIEVSVKSFWSNLNLHVWAPEVANVWAVFWSNEIQHFQFYSNLLDILWLNGEFETILHIPAIKKRIDLLNKWMEWGFINKLIFFTLFTENVSLFSQFLCLMSINKHKTYLKGMSNWISASTKDEFLHTNFWVFLINTIKKEYPDMINKETFKWIVDLVTECLANEIEIVDWIFEKWDLPYLRKQDIKQYIEYRMWLWLNMIGMEFNWHNCPECFDWFELELSATSDIDFFNKRSINYSKKAKSITEDDLF